MRFLPIAVLTLSLSVDAAEVRIDVVDASGEPIPDVVVSLHDGTTHEPSVAARARIDQVERQFHPRVSAVRTGTTVEFPNSDNVRHHVYSFSHPNHFELKLYRGREASPVTFRHAGTVVLGCNIHDHMVGRVRVLDTPWFATTSSDGRVTIDGAPEGDYDVELWHPTHDAPHAAGRITLTREPSRHDYVLAIEPDTASDTRRPSSALQSLFDD